MKSGRNGARQSPRRAGSAIGTTRWCAAAASWWRGRGLSAPATVAGRGLVGRLLGLGVEPPREH